MLVACTSARTTSTSAQRTRRQDSGDSKTLAKTVVDHKKCDSEYQEQLSNTGDRVAATQEKSITEFDDDNSSSFRLYISGVPTATCGVNEVDNSAQRVRVARSARRSKQAFSDRECISEVDAELWKISDDILVLMDMNFIPSTSTGSPRGLLRDEKVTTVPKPGFNVEKAEYRNPCSIE